MDKKTGIIVGVLVFIVVALIIGAFIGDSKDSSILTINDINYSAKDFESYYKIRYFEELTKNENSAETENEGEDTVANNVDKEELKNTAINEYTTYMIVNKEAKDKGFHLSEETIKSIEKQYDAEEFDRETLTSLGVSRDDYIATQKVVETYNNYISSVDEYYDIPQSTIDNYLELNKDILKGIDFRIMHFNITSTEATTNENGEEVPATSNKEEITAKAQEILDRVKAGEDFETLAKENANQRYAYTNTELKQVNGELESCDIPYLQSYFMFSCQDIEEPLKALKTPGEYTDLVITDTYVAFAKLEAVRDEVQDETMENVKKSLAQSIGESYLASIVQSSSVIVNNRLLKSIEI